MIDDNSEDNEFHQIIIERMHITDNIAIAQNGEEAIDYLKSEDNIAPELIFLDINMPRMNGWEFLEEYRHLTINNKQIIIMMLTTSANPEDKARAQKIVELKGFKTKPLSAAMLTEILESYF